MKKRILALMLSMTMLLNLAPLNSVVYAGEAENPVTVLLDGQSVESVTILADEETTLTARAEGIMAVSCQWEIFVPGAELWVAVDGYDESDCAVSKALVGSVLDSMGRARLRCTVTGDDGTSYTSDAVTVTVSRETAVSQQKVEPVYYPGQLGEAEVIDLVEETASAAPVVEETAPAAPVVEETAPAAPVVAAEGTDDTTGGTATVEVKYIFLDQSIANTSTKYNVPLGSPFVTQVTLPTIVGYIPFVYKTGTDATYYDLEHHRLYSANGASTELKEGDAGYDSPNEKLSGSYTVRIENVTKDETVTIVYLPAMVKYTVVHYTEDLVGNGYTEHSRYEHMGMTGYPVPDNLAKDHLIEGFTPMDYERLNVAATGNTQIHIYHHRNYYLVDFDLNDPDNTAYGVRPVFVRYQTQVTVSNPVRPGYNFAGWTLTGYGRTGTDWNTPTQAQVTTYAMVNRTVTVPASDLKYQARWSQDASYYTVVYWREAESVYGDTEVQYEYWGSKIIGGTEMEGGGVQTDGSVQSGAELNYTKFTTVPADISTVTHDANTFNEAQYFTYNSEKTAEANTDNIVHGDGTSVINIYFDRKSYNLKFYYAFSTGTGDNITYSVVGGSTYYFGSMGQNTDDDVRLLENYTTGSRQGETGQVEALPSLNSSGNSKGYTLGSTTRGAYTYYYLAFQAKYGMNISSMWPTDVFASVTTSETYNNDGYSSNIAWMSAWNGEHHVYYSQKNSNQTIKGKYNKLGYQILWDNVSDNPVASTAADENEPIVTGTVSVTGEDGTVTETTNTLTADGTVAYLCFWENGAKINWSVPELYRYNIWLEALDQANAPDGTEGTAWKKYNEKYYIFQESYDTVDNSTVDQQTDPPIQGFSNVGRDSTALKPGDSTTDTTYDEDLYKEGYDVNFYYDRNEYNLTFNNHGQILLLKDAQGNDMDKATIRYGVSLYAAGGVELDESYLPSSMEKGGYVFEGWYTSDTFAPATKFVFDENTTMPAEDLYLYANWVPKEHLVYVYHKQDDAVNTEGGSIYGNTAKALSTNGVKILHGNKAPTPAEPNADGDAPFLGWFYCDNYDEAGNYLGYDADKETAWSFDSMTVTHDLVIYAKYNYAFMNDYVIHFYKKVWDENTNSWVKPAEDVEPVPVAPDKEGTGVAGDHVLVKAAVGEELYESYRTHWFPDPYSDSLQLSTVQDEVTEYTIWYTEQAAVPYTVKYVDTDGKELVDSKEVLDNIYSYVTETYLYIPDYVPDAYQKSLAVSTAEDAQNIITFVYSSQTDQTIYRVEYYMESVDGTYVLDSNRFIEGIATINGKLTLDNDATKSNSDAFEWNTDKTSVTSGGSDYARFTAADGIVTVSDMPAKGVLVKLYYDRRNFAYQVHYHEITAEDSACPGNDLRGVSKGMAKYGTTLTLNPVPITGYHTVGAGENAALTIGMDEANNVYTYWYEEDKITVNYVVVGGATNSAGEFVKGGTLSLETGAGGAITGEPIGSVAQANAGFTFVGWYLNEACTLPVNPSWVKENVDENGVTGTKLTPGKVDYSSTDTTQVYKNATYYAKFVRNTADLTISTTFPANNNYREVDGRQTFLFQICGSSDATSHINIIITLHERESKTLADLPTGEYTVTELTNSAWRYNPDSASKTVQVLPEQENVVTFVETRAQNDWLDGNAQKAVNSFSPYQEGVQ